jgi:hypothetical protein
LFQTLAVQHLNAAACSPQRLLRKQFGSGGFANPHQSRQIQYV